MSTFLGSFWKAGILAVAVIAPNPRAAAWRSTASRLACRASSSSWRCLRYTVKRAFINVCVTVLSGMARSNTATATSGGGSVALLCISMWARDDPGAGPRCCAAISAARMLAPNPSR